MIVKSLPQNVWEWTALRLNQSWVLPLDLAKTEVIPYTIRYTSKQNPRWSDMNLDEFLHVLGIILSRGVIELHGPQYLYREMKENSLFPSLKYGKVMSLKRFESILRYFQFSSNADPDQQILDFAESVNKNFQSSLVPGSYVTLDESMIKSFHQNLEGKIKIIRKPRSIGNEMKTLSDAMSNIVLKTAKKI